MHKYEMYLRAVQDPEGTLDWIEKEYRRRCGAAPQIFGEDFCGTFALSCAWVERGPQHTAVAVDASLTPIRYGMRHYLSALTENEQKRVRVLQSDVRHPRLPRVDVLCAFNFSYLVFKTSEELLSYFKNCRRRLKSNGLLVLDLFGGSEVQHPNIDQTKYRDFTYFWEQTSFDPLTNVGRFYIHFQENRKKRMSKAFAYHWRLWTIPELRELLLAAGFQEVYVDQKPLRSTAWIAQISARTKK
jgi:SAM-dependent methyltransferase